jgi:1-acyl-sn-glycerol-3-phosphate acyltransferase
MSPFYRFSHTVVRAFFRLLFGFRAVESHRVPLEGPLILASNHRSYLDPPLIGVSLEREVHFMAKAELFSFAPFGRLITALNAHPVRRGRKDAAAVERMTELLKAGNAVVIFPEGTRERTGRGLGRAKTGVARLALASGAPIQIVYIRGSRSKLRAIFRRPAIHVHFGRIIGASEAGRYGADPKGFNLLARHILDEIGRLMREVEGGGDPGRAEGR